jgi:hypothetical protein
MTQQARIITRSLNGILIRARHNGHADNAIRILPAMRNTATPTARPQPVPAYQARFAWWLAVAVFLHALLLLIPIGQGPLPRPALTTLTVALSRTLQTPPPATPAESSRREAAPAERRLARPGGPNADLPPAAASRAAPLVPALDAGVAPDAAPAPVTTARLLDFAHRREWNLREPSVAPGLEVFRPQPPRPNWRSGTPADGTPADGTAPPAKSGIVDQWLAADGSHNVMIRTSTGQVLCGRAEAWNPMSPLVEPVMTYRACGDGRRTFEMPERVLLR